MRPSEAVWAAARREPDPGPRPLVDTPTDSLAQVAERVLAGEDGWHEVRNFLDTLPFLTLAGRVAAVAAEPRPTGRPEWDAFLAALAEHFSARWGVAPPAWCLNAERFLGRFWWLSTTPALRAIALRDSPAAFRRRGLFIGATTLDRA